MGGHDTDGPVSSFASANVAIATASRIITVVTEVRAPCVGNCKVQSCTGAALSTSVDCVFGSNITYGNLIHVFAGALSTSTTISLSGCAAVPFSAPDTQTTGWGTTYNQWYGIASSTTSCTLTFNSTASVDLLVLAEEYSGGATTLDGHALAPSTGASIRTGPSISATNDGELVLGTFLDSSNTVGCTYTAGSGFEVVNFSTARNCAAKEMTTQTAAGVIAPTMGASALAGDTIAAGTISFSGGGAVTDAGADGGTQDAGDGGESDSGAPDGGADAGEADSGVSSAGDGGEGDSGTSDGGVDAGESDSGPGTPGEADSGLPAPSPDGQMRLQVGCGCGAVDCATPWVWVAAFAFAMLDRRRARAGGRRCSRTSGVL